MTRNLQARRPPQGAEMDQSELVVDRDLRNFMRVISVCTLGFWAFAAGLLIGVLVF
jgi:hypothetical protein